VNRVLELSRVSWAGEALRVGTTRAPDARQSARSDAPYPLSLVIENPAK